jgi:hypothetical protein
MISSSGKKYRKNRVAPAPPAQVAGPVAGMVEFLSTSNLFIHNLLYLICDACSHLRHKQISPHLPIFLRSRQLGRLPAIHILFGIEFPVAKCFASPTTQGFFIPAITKHATLPLPRPPVRPLCLCPWNPLPPPALLPSTPQGLPRNAKGSQ